MAKTEIISKRLAINNANAQVVAIVGIAAFITVFCLMASKAVFSQNTYQSRVISATSKAKTQLQSNITAYNQLVKSYENFTSGSTNILGGQVNGTGQNTGNNAQIVLDALPAAYDFPGLTSTLQKIFNNGNYQLSGITGTDEQLTEQSNTTSANPSPVAMPFTFTVDNTSYQAIGQLIHTLQQSIRPIQIQGIQMTGGGSDMTLTVSAQTYYQPSKSLSITQQEIK